MLRRCVERVSDERVTVVMLSFDRGGREKEDTCVETIEYIMHTRI